MEQKVWESEFEKRTEGFMKSEVSTFSRMKKDAGLNQRLQIKEIELQGN